MTLHRNKYIDIIVGPEIKTKQLGDLRIIFPKPA